MRLDFVVSVTLREAAQLGTLFRLHFAHLQLQSVFFPVLDLDPAPPGLS